MRLIGNVEKDAQVRAVASGALPSGDAVIVNADGTVSVIEGTAQALGSPAVFESATSYYCSATFDSNSNKVVIAYQDAANNQYGTAVVGTVSGTSISFGTPVVFDSTPAVYITATFDSNSNKVVLAYRDNSSTGTAIVGTVSGTTISFGTPVVFFAAAANYNAITFDSNLNKVVIAFQPPSVTYSRYLSVVVGTVSGTSISFGSRVVASSTSSNNISLAFDSNSNKVVLGYRSIVGSFAPPTAIVGAVSGTTISFGSSVEIEASISIGKTATVFDSNSNKTLISYVDSTNGGHGKAVVGTVSGTGISFGSVVTFSAADTDYPAMTFDSTSNKIVISYQDDADSDKGKLIVGTVSGTSISFESPVEFSGNASYFISSAFDSNSSKVVISYSSNTFYGTAFVFQPESTNLTSENYIGFAAHTYADTQSALVNSSCTVDRNQSGLTAGQTYYVQSDGSLGTTAADPPVVAGTAISSTEIIVKG